MSDFTHYRCRFLANTGCRRRLLFLPINKTLYVTAEDFYFAKNRLLDLAESFVKWGGKYLFVDEIHKYPNWSRYYPFAVTDDFDLRLQQVINQTLETDIPTYAGMNVSTGRKLKQLLAIVAESVPFKPNMSKIAEILNISRNNIADYLLYLEEAGMIAQLRDAVNGIRGLGKVDKVSFADFTIDTMDFEIGGKNKGRKQIVDAQKGFVVKDGIEKGFLNIIPLWHFGLMY